VCTGVVPRFLYLWSDITPLRQSDVTRLGLDRVLANFPRLRAPLSDDVLAELKGTVNEMNVRESLPRQQGKEWCIELAFSQ
jgi:hypothetical protein